MKRVFRSVSKILLEIHFEASSTKNDATLKDTFPRYYSLE